MSNPCENCVVYPVCRNRLISLAKKRATSYNAHWQMPVNIAKVVVGSTLLNTSFLKCEKLERYIWKLVDNSFDNPQIINMIGDDISMNTQIINIISEHSVVIFSLTKTEMDSIEKETYNEIDSM
jgi:hypothetical protein